MLLFVLKGGAGPREGNLGYVSRALIIGGRKFQVILNKKTNCVIQISTQVLNTYISISLTISEFLRTTCNTFIICFLRFFLRL